MIQMIKIQILVIISIFVTTRSSRHDRFVGVSGRGDPRFPVVPEATGAPRNTVRSGRGGCD